MNPSYSPTTGANKATAPKSDQNVKDVVVPRTHNPFTLTHTFLTTEDYGTYNPVACVQVTPGDHIPIKVSNIVRSDSFNTPLLTPITKTFDTFMVPMFAILPNTWDYIYSNPTQGDDVPSDANTCIRNFRYTLQTILSNFITRISNVTTSGTFTVAAYNKYASNIAFHAFFLESVFSSGSLLHRLGYKLTPYFTKSVNGSVVTVYRNIDFLLDDIFNSLADNTYMTNIVDGIVRSYSVGSQNLSLTGENFTLTAHEYISLMREHYSDPEWVISVHNASIGGAFVTDIKDILNGLIPNLVTTNEASDKYFENFNYASILAYQLVNAQYFVNPSVDYLYNAELYRNAMYGLLKAAGIITLNNLDFERNGHVIKYDTFSSHFISAALSEITKNSFTPSSLVSYESWDKSKFQFFFAIFFNIFALQNTLRFGDYFVASKPRPLAIGDSSAPVDADGNSVGGVDVVRAIAMARFLQACNKTSSDYTDQIKAMTGKDTPPDFHFPHFVSHDEMQLNSYEVSNTTSEALGDQVTRIDTASSVEPVSIDIDLHGYIIVISGTYMPRTYSRTKFRHFFQEDRFDIFQEMLQNIGDQPLYQIERNDNFIVDTFGYQGRNEEYKQLYNHASGAFVDILKSWAFISDGSDSFGYKLDANKTISPEYIRCYPAEFDRFLPVDAYLSLGHHYHFINMYNIAIEANRPMMQSPSIL